MIWKNVRTLLLLAAASFLFLLAFLLLDIRVGLRPFPVQAAGYQLSATRYATTTIPGLINYQGLLASDTGAPVNGAITMTFRVYSTTTGSTALWSEIHTAVPVTKGTFSVLLGEITPFPDNLFADPSRYLSVQIGSNPEMAPRQRFTSVAYAFEARHAQSADLLGGLPLTSLAPLSHTHTVSCTPKLRYFQEAFTIPTQGAADWEFFTLEGENYLIVANYMSGTTRNANSTLYRWNGSFFTPTQTFATEGAAEWRFFTINNEAYLGVANQSNNSTYNVDSKIYHWNGTNFTEFQSIPTQGAQDLEFFTLSGIPYLAIANHYNGTTCNIDSKIYRWDGTKFTETQSIPTQGAQDWEYFILGNESYLAVANSFNDITNTINSRIYRWTGTKFTETQSIPTVGSRSLKFFKINNQAYLVTANFVNGSNYSINSTIYRWDGSSFKEFQSIPTQGALDWNFFTIGKENYLAEVNFILGNPGNDPIYNINSKLFHWNGTEFRDFQNIPTSGADAITSFSLQGSTYFAIANFYNGSIYNIDSVIYRAELEDCPTVGPTETYLQLDTLQSAPPAIDCDESTELGRAKVDVEHNVLYICTNSGWITK